MDRIEPALSITAGGAQSERLAGSIRVAQRRLDLAVTVDERTARDIRLIRRHPKITFWLFAGLLICLVWQRCPTILSRAQFWAEDGWVWYPQCYAVGWRCVLIDHTAYLQTISRLVALLSLFWPLSSAPRVFAISALLIQAAPAIFLVSSRMSAAIPSLGVRVALALLLVAIPGMSEVYVNVTNSQWHLALLAFLVLVAAPAVTWPQRGFETLVLLVGGLSGPFSPVLVPVAILWCWCQPGRWQVWRLAVILMTAATQLSLVFWHQTSRAPGGAVIGWSLHRLINIIDVDILGVAAFGRQTIIQSFWLPSEGWLSNGQPLPTLIAGCLLLGALLLAIIAFLRGPWVLRAFLIFAGLEFAASLVDGLPIGKSLWADLEGDIGMRYYFHPIAAWLAVVVTLICDRNLPLRTIGVALIALTVTVAIPSDWALPKLPRSAFHHDAKLFDRAPPGTTMDFPIRPNFLDHDMVLVKH